MHYGNVLYVSSMLLFCPKHYDNVRFFDTVKCIMAMYRTFLLCFYSVQSIMTMCVSSRLSNVLWQCMFLLCCPMHYGIVCFFDAVKCIMAMYVSSMAIYLSAQIGFLECTFLLCCRMYYGNVCFFFYAFRCIIAMCFFDIVKCILAMYVSSMLSNALRQCVFLRCCQMQFPSFHN